MTNLQGDVVAIIDANGNPVVQYTYDAWGKILSISGSLADTLGTTNPLTYRGYVYDPETDLYYLQSRYYDPAVGRFLNSDVFASTGQDLIGHNMFAYCGNNPINRADNGGYFWDFILDVCSLVVSVVEVIQNPTDVNAWIGLALDVVDVAVPMVGGLGEMADAFNAARKTVDAVDDARDVAKTADKVVDTSTKAARSRAVRQAWKNEAELVRTTGKGTREWTEDQMQELITTGKVKGFHGHHMKSVQGYPHLAGDPSNIQFLTRKEHLAAHSGNWRNITHGRYIIP